MGLLDDCETHFGHRDLYKVYHIEKSANDKTLKKAYYQQSLKWHPDRFSDVPDDDAKKADATIKFQIVSKVYEVLSDKEKRAYYDETGVAEEGDEVDEENFERNIKMWRAAFKKVTKEDIERFMQEYTGSDEEREDVLHAYARFNGDLDKILETVIGGDDEAHIRGIIDEMIVDGTLKSSAKYKAAIKPAKITARQKKANKEAKEAEKMLKEIQEKEGSSDLQALILKRQSARAGNSFLDNLEAKYAEPAKKKSRKGK